jgi:hypothetical protein
VSGGPRGAFIVNQRHNRASTFIELARQKNKGEHQMTNTTETAHGNSEVVTLIVEMTVKPEYE